MEKALILIALGANLPGPDGRGPKATLEAALARLEVSGVRVAVRSRWYESRPEPPSDQPRYVNGVALVETALGPPALLGLLHAIEAAFGRRRGRPNAARVLDLDLLAHGDTVTGDGVWPRLPHPRLHERAFVLKPLAEVAPGWRHPALGRTVEELMAALGADRLAAASAILV